MSCINNVCTYLSVQKVRVGVAIAIVFLYVLYKCDIQRLQKRESKRFN